MIPVFEIVIKADFKRYVMLYIDKFDTFFSTLFIIKRNNDSTKLFSPFLVPSPSMITKPSLPPTLPKRSPGYV